MTEQSPRHLAMRPQGIAGRAFATAMEVLNARAYARAVELTDVQTGWRVLEIGFGTGRLLQMVSRAAPAVSVAGIDPTPDMVARARNRPELRNLHEAADLREGTADHLPWPDASFDAVIAVHSYQFWADPDRCLKEIARVLRPGRRVILILRHHGVRAPRWLPNPISRSGDEVAGTRALLAANRFADIAEAPSLGKTRIVTAVRQHG